MPVKDAEKPPMTLAHVLSGLEHNRAISDVRRRDLRSAVNRVARLHGDEPGRIPLDMPTISQRLTSAMPAAAGLSQKNLANVRSDFSAAVRKSGIRPAPSPTNTPMTPSWRKLMTDPSAKRMHIGLSHLARWCSGRGIEPERVTVRRRL